MWKKKGNSPTMLVGMLIGTRYGEECGSSLKPKNRTAIWPSSPTLDIYLEKKKNSNSKRYMHLYSVHSSTIYNNQDRKQANYLLTEEWIKKIGVGMCVCVCVCI